MKQLEFNSYLERARTVDIKNDIVFNTDGYFWINLTDTQHMRMYNLLIFQGNEPENGEIRMANGLGIIDIKNKDAMSRPKI